MCMWLDIEARSLDNDDNDNEAFCMPGDNLLITSDLEHELKMPCMDLFMSKYEILTIDFKIFFIPNFNCNIKLHC